LIGDGHVKIRRSSWPERQSEFFIDDI